MRSLYKRLKSNTRYQELLLGIFFFCAILTYIFDTFTYCFFITNFLKDFVMPIISPFIFLIFEMITTENEKIQHKIRKS